jgi:hypothetical protein
MRAPLKNANLLVRFLLELSALAATAYWGFATSSGLTQWLLGIAAPAAVATVWGLFVSPKAKIELPRRHSSRSSSRSSPRPLLRS